MCIFSTHNNHRRRQNVVRTMARDDRLVYHWCSFRILTTSVSIAEQTHVNLYNLFVLCNKKTVMPSFMGLSSKWSRTQSKCENNSIYYMKYVLEKGVICNTVVSYYWWIRELIYMASLFLHAGTPWTIGSPNLRYKTWSNKILKFWVAWLETSKRERDK